MHAEPEINAFLKARRAALDPAGLGLPPGGTRRRVRGLRRDEAAHLAEISVEYYTRIEQGRGGNVSPEVLDSLARGLRLTAAEHEYLRNVAHRAAHAATTRCQVGEEAPQVVRPGLRVMIDAMDGVAAVVYGRAMDVLAWNRLGGLIGCDFARLPPGERNIAKQMFLRADVEAGHPEVAQVRREIVAVLRAEAGRFPDSVRLCHVVGELLESSPEFARLWESQEVEEKTYGVKRVIDPRHGLLELQFQAMRLPPPDDELTLLLYAAEPDSPTRKALRALSADAEEHGALPATGTP
ncbi:helix-turn-helix transcriptional regulator [Streptomyces sp. NPDC087270]|uniref:helix-turn-helix transcriptional regulator n=1 Tax=Streptomyces sp. NPDC087270 TaxID=3365774 RepID=UPI0038053A7C